MKSDDLTAIVDFLYYGEANVYQEKLESFLAIAGELQLKGLEGSKDQDGANGEEQLKLKEKTNHIGAIPRPLQTENEVTHDSNKTGNNALALPKTSVMSANSQELDETVKSMMETSENMVQVGNRQRHAKMCKVCGREGHETDIKRHIESSHLEGMSVPCSLCDKIFRSRHSLWFHIKRNHKQ